ncbi:MAG TPA: glycosyltransferase family A protein [Xanthobacteraceae bacterium]
MSFSVVLPNYNHGKLLPRAVLSLMEQNLPPDEIVIIDDASTDDSLAIIARLKDRFSCIRLIRHERNQGTVVGMNDGLQAATRDFVYFFAADDYCLPGFITAATQSLAQHPEAAFFCGRIVLVDPAGKILGFRPFMWPASRSTMLTPAAVRAKIAASDNWSAGTSVVYRRRRLIEAGGFDNSMGAFCDGLMVRKLAFESGFYFASVVVAAMERYPQSLSAQAALSIEKNTRLIATATAAVKASFPSDVSVVYSDLLTPVAVQYGRPLALPQITNRYSGHGSGVAAFAFRPRRFERHRQTAVVALDDPDVDGFDSSSVQCRRDASWRISCAKGALRGDCHRCTDRRSARSNAVTNPRLRCPASSGGNRARPIFA